MSTNSSISTKKQNGGKTNPKYVDLLELDKPIAGQQFGCFSFITPEKILKQKEMFFFESFLKKWEFTKSITSWWNGKPRTRSESTGMDSASSRTSASSRRMRALSRRAASSTNGSLVG